MSNSMMLTIVNEFLKDLMNSQRHFDGKVIVLGGDFQKVLPVVPGGGRAEQVLACIKNNNLCPLFTKHSLKVNMRAIDDLEYSNWLLKLGEDKLERIDENLTLIPRHLITIGAIEDFVYPQRIDPAESLDLMTRVILAITNKQCDQVNLAVQKRIIFQDEKKYTSIDSILNDKDNTRCLDFPPEILNKVDDSSLPSHKLKLRVGAIVMLL